MINELFFLLHTITVIATSLIFLRLGSTWLISLLSLYVLLSNLFVTQQIALFGFNVTSTDVFAVGTTITLNLIQEFFGASLARRAIIISLGLSVVFLIMSMFNLMYTPNMYDTMHPHFAAIFAWTPRIICASIISYFIVQWADTYLYQFLYRRFKGDLFIGRAATSLIITQILDTIFFSFAGLYGLVGSINHVIMVSLAIKFIIIFLSTPLLCLVKYSFNQGNKT